MNFLAPLFLAAAAAIVGPLIAHMVRRTTKQRVSFSATRFLAPSAPRFEKRSQLEHPWLLLLRCLVVLLLAAAFARPFLRQELPAFASPAAPRNVAILLDESASMRRAGIWDAARARVEDLAADLRADDRLVLFAMAEGAHELISEETWMKTPAAERHALVATVLAARKPGWNTTHLDTAMDAALERLEELSEKQPTARKTVIVVSDFAAGTRVAGLAGREWPKGGNVVLERIQPSKTGNAGIQWLGWSPDTGRGVHARVKVSRDHTAGTSSLRVQLVDAVAGKNLGEAQSLALASGEARVLSLPVPAGFAGPLRVELTGDGEAFDNAVTAAKPEPRQMDLVYVGRHAATDTQHARFYLERAAVGRDPVVTVRAVDSYGEAAAIGGSGTSKTFFVVTEPLSEPLAQSMRARLSDGAFTLVLLGDPAMVTTAQTLAGETGWRPAEKSAKDALLGKVDFAHPLFASFADPRFSDFSRIHFWKPQGVSLPAASTTRVVANFDDGTPAVLETTVGRGGVIAWGGDWSPASSQWVLSTKFVPWLQALLERAAGGAARPAIATVGEAVRLVEGAGTWRAAPAQGQAQGADLKEMPREPGLFRLSDVNGDRWVALQLASEESRTDELPVDTFEQLGVPVKSATAADEKAQEQLRRQESTSEIEGRQKLWWWLLLGAAALLAVESMVAWTLSRRQIAVGETV